MSGIDLTELDLVDFFDKLEQVESLADGHLFDMIDYTTGTTNSISMVVKRLEREDEEGMLFYAYTRSVGRAEDRLRRLGLTLHMPWSDPDDSGYVFVFVQFIEEESEEEEYTYGQVERFYPVPRGYHSSSDNSDSDSDGYGASRRRSYRPTGSPRYAYESSDSDDGLSSLFGALAVQESRPSYVVHEHHYHVDNSHYTYAPRSESHHYEERNRGSDKNQALREAAKIAGVAVGAAATAGCSIM